MQPYQSATEEVRRQGELPHKAISTATALGTTALGGIALNKIVPLLSKYVPEALAVKGLTKIDSRFGDFIGKAKDAGKSFDEIKSFIKEKTGIEEPQDEIESTAKQDVNIIKQYSPELDSYISEQVQSGRPVIEAGALAQNDKRFSSVIDRLTKDHRTQWSNILQSVYGSEKVKKPEMQNRNAGSGDEALLAALDKILKM